MSKNSDGLGLGLIAGIALTVVIASGGNLSSLIPEASAATTQTTPQPLVPADPNCHKAQRDEQKEFARTCWAPLINQYGWNKDQAFKILWCESRGDPNAKNPHSTATGLFQILNGTTDPTANVKQAYEMYGTRGWQPWACKP